MPEVTSLVCNICGEPTASLRYHFGSACEECGELVDTTINAIRVARRVGVPKYGPSSWRDVSAQEHLSHASGHVNIAWYATQPTVEDHLSHAICRLAMAKAIQDA